MSCVFRSYWSLRVLLLCWTVTALISGCTGPREFHLEVVTEASKIVADCEQLGSAIIANDQPKPDSKTQEELRRIARHIDQFKDKWYDCAPDHKYGLSTQLDLVYLNLQAISGALIECHSEPCEHGLDAELVKLYRESLDVAKRKFSAALIDLKAK